VSAVESPLERFSALSREERDELIAEQARARGVSPARVKATLLRSWRFVARPKQLAPPGAWTYWLLMAGRGFGKTLTGAQWSKERALERRCRIGLIAPTRADVRATMVEGETGLLSVLPPSALLGQSREAAWNKTTLELTLANGTIFSGFSSERPDRVRGPQHDYVWGEEFSSWKDANKSADDLESTFNNMKLGLRLGPRPQACLTGTPKANKLTRELVALEAGGSLVKVSGSSYENRSNLSEAWWSDVVAPLEGTRTGRQEIEAELLEDVEGALWTKGMLDLTRERMPPGWQSDPLVRQRWLDRMQRIVVGVDPNTTSGESADAAGIVVAGLSFQQGYVLDDRTQERGGPAAWAQAAVDAYHDWEADKIVVETNNGGEMCEMVIHGVDPSVPVKRVTASRGKRTRAEPVAILYVRDEERGREERIRHVGVLPELEDEMTTWTPEEESPNRMDAAVWALTELAVWKPPARTSTTVPKGRLPGVAERRSAPPIDIRR
jgi:phage terminase large subunit-like protein